MHRLLAPCTFFLFTSTAACSAAQVSAFESALAKGDTALVDATPLACDILDITDPANAKGICQVLDDAGNAVGVVLPVVETVGQLQALVKAHPAKTSSAGAALAAAKAKLLAKKP